MDCPAGMVTSPPGATAACAGAWSGTAGAGAGGGAGAAIGASLPRPVKVKATTSLVLKVCTSPLTSKRRMAAVPPRYRPCTTLPLFNSRVSAAAKLTKNNATATATKKRFTLRITSSLVCKLQIPRNPLSSPMPKHYSTALDDVAAFQGCVKKSGFVFAKREGPGKNAQTLRPVERKRLV